MNAYILFIRKRSKTTTKPKESLTQLSNGNGMPSILSVLGDEAQVSPMHSAIFLNHHVILSLYFKQNISKMQDLGL